MTYIVSGGAFNCTQSPLPAGENFLLGCRNPVKNYRHINTHPLLLKNSFRVLLKRRE